MDRSQTFFAQGKTLIPGGVNSPVRACGSVGTTPLFISRAEGATITDVDNRQYIDYVLSWGPLILGHAHPEVTSAIAAQMGRGTSYGAPTTLEIDMAATVAQAFPSMEMIRMVNSGTEAVMSAIRLARGVTGREKIVKFEGCYHGHADSLLVKAGSGVATLGIPGTPGVPRCLAELTLTLPYNDVHAVTGCLETWGDDIACIIVEPVAGNMGVVPPSHGFLETLRDATRRKGILLIFDEVITGFRFTWGGFQNLAGIEPDLTCLGKIIGGGLPVGAFGGRRAIMEQLAPTGPVYQAGTLSGNPLAMAAGLATLEIIRQQAPRYEDLDRRSKDLCDGLAGLFREKGLDTTINRMGSMFTPFFSPEAVRDFKTAGLADTDLYGRFYRGMRKAGVNLPPSQFEAWFLSFAHTGADCAKTLDACRCALADL